jgi:rRNA maturation RNase YbeY
MSYAIDIELDSSVTAVHLEPLETAVRTALRHQVVEAGELSLLLSDDGRLQDLNRQFRAIDAPTDVLSFPSGETAPPFPGGIIYLGDIAISVPYAQRQAAAAGHGLLEELQLLAVHGTLHLLGHDHTGEADKALMWSAQQEIMSDLGLAHVAPTEG